jgi:hypothetical protein
MNLDRENFVWNDCHNEQTNTPQRKINTKNTVLLKLHTYTSRQYLQEIVVVHLVKTEKIKSVAVVT